MGHLMIIIIGEGGKGGAYNDDYNRGRWERCDI